MAVPQAGDIGTKIRYNAQESLAAETVLKLKWRKKPSNVDGLHIPETTGEWLATVYNANSAQYITSSAIDFIAGIIEIQIYIETPTWKGHSEVKEFIVKPNLTED